MKNTVVIAAKAGMTMILRILMFQPLALYIGLRYTRAKRKNHFISFISLASMIGIALGVAVLITVLSVMNGIDEEIHKRVFAMVPGITVAAFDGAVDDWQKTAEKIKPVPGVLGVSPYIEGQGLLAHSGQARPVLMYGILPEQEQQVSGLKEKMIQGTLEDLKVGSFGVLLPRKLADRFGLRIGDKVVLMVPKATTTLVGVIPRFKRFKLVGVFDAGSGFGFERMTFTNLKDAQRMFDFGNNVSGLRVKIQNLYAAPRMTFEIAQRLPEALYVNNWTQSFGAFFETLSMEKTSMFLILLLIILVAMFNLVSSLVMVVTDKQADIAILRTLGALPQTILRIFIIQGSIIGITGTVLGLIGGITLSLNTTEVVMWLQNLLDMRLFTSEVYLFDNLPSKLEWQDLIKVCTAALTMSLLATLYPAWRAARTQPAEALRYE